MINKMYVFLICLTLNFMVNASSMQGQPAPTFNLMDQNDVPHQLNDYAGSWLVVYFYPKDDTTGCTIEAKAFRDNYSTLKAMNAEVLGVSFDDAASHRDFIDKYDLPFNLLVDSNKVMSKAYGVDGGMAFLSYAKRQTFIIDPEGNIAKHFEEVNPSTHYDEVHGSLVELQAEITPVKKHADEVVVTTETDEYVIYGKTWTDKDDSAINLASALSEPNDYLAEKSVMTGRITRVCQKQGCWMILADGEMFARVDFNNHAFLIPKNTSGDAAVYGQLLAKELTAEQQAHYESEGSGDLKSNSYEIIADSVKVYK
jgi:peroxiredoxin Q/BCP